MKHIFWIAIALIPSPFLLAVKQSSKIDHEPKFACFDEIFKGMIEKVGAEDKPWVWQQPKKNSYIQCLIKNPICLTLVTGSRIEEKLPATILLEMKEKNSNYTFSCLTNEALSALGAFTNGIPVESFIHNHQVCEGLYRLLDYQERAKAEINPISSAFLSCQKKE